MPQKTCHVYARILPGLPAGELDSELSSSLQSWTAPHPAHAAGFGPAARAAAMQRVRHSESIQRADSNRCDLGEAMGGNGQWCFWGL
jgi:hypothetical protein